MGTQREFGFELKANHYTDRTRLGISHGFTKLYSFDLNKRNYYASLGDYRSEAAAVAV